MRFSLRSSFFAVFWLAFLIASLTTGNQLTCDAFVALQYVMFAVSFAIALNPRATDRWLAVGFAAGFAAFLLMLGAESALDSLSEPKHSIFGRRIRSLAGILVQLKEHIDNTAGIENRFRLESVIRSATGTGFGTMTAIFSLLAGNSKSEQP